MLKVDVMDVITMNFVCKYKSRYNKVSIDFVYSEQLIASFFSHNLILSKQNAISSVYKQ